MAFLLEQSHIQHKLNFFHFNFLITIAVLLFLSSVQFQNVNSSAIDNIKKKCSKSFIEVCSTGSREKFCCVTGGQRCCDKDQYNEDQSKILQEIVKLERERDEMANGKSRGYGSDTEYISAPDQRWKKGVIACAVLIVIAVLFFCLVDLIFNVSKVCFSSKSDSNGSINGKHNRNFKYDVSGSTSSSHASPPKTSVASANPDTIPEEVLNMQDNLNPIEFDLKTISNDARGKRQRSHNSHNSSPESGYSNKRDHLTDDELIYLKSHCDRLFHDDSNISHHLKDKVTFYTLPRITRSEKGSPILSERFAKPSKPNPVFQNKLKSEALARGGGAIPKSSSLKFATMHFSAKEFSNTEAEIEMEPMIDAPRKFSLPPLSPLVMCSSNGGSNLEKREYKSDADDATEC